MVRRFFIEPCISLFFRLDGGSQPPSSPVWVNEKVNSGGDAGSPLRRAAGRYTENVVGRDAHPHDNFRTGLLHFRVSDFVRIEHMIRQRFIDLYQRKVNGLPVMWK
jgi:hypothetical protein